MISEFMTLDIKDKSIVSSKAYVSTENEESSFRNKYLRDAGEYKSEFEIPARSLITIDIDLEPDKDYVEVPVVEKKENPFVADPNKPAIPYALIIFGTAALIISAVIITVVLVRKNGGSDNAS